MLDFLLQESVWKSIGKTMSPLFKFLVIAILKPQYLMIDLTKTNSFLNINIHFFELTKQSI